MAIELIDKIKPKNNGSFAMVDAGDVEMEDGTRLPDAIPKIQTVTKDEYNALVEAGEDDPDVYYMIARDEV